MTTRPYLLAFAACVAGFVATAPVALVLAVGGEPGWWMLGCLSLGVPVFAGVAAGVMHLENKQAATQKWAEIKRQQIRNATDEWGLRVAQREAAVASGLAGAREAEAKERAWANGLEILFRAGDAAGSFSGAALAGVVGSDTHPMLMEFYTSAAGLCILRNVGGNKGHRWGYKPDGELWALGDVLALLQGFKLPHPEGDVPEIKRPADSAALRKAARKSAKQESTVIDGTAREVGQ